MKLLHITNIYIIKKIIYKYYLQILQLLYNIIIIYFTRYLLNNMWNIRLFKI